MASIPSFAFHLLLLMLDSCRYLAGNIMNTWVRDNSTHKNTEFLATKMETGTFFCPLLYISEMPGLVEIWNVGYWWWKALKLSSFKQAAQSYVYQASTKLHTREIAFVFLSIYSWVWYAGILGCMTLPCVLKWIWLMYALCSLPVLWSQLWSYSCQHIIQ